MTMGYSTYVDIRLKSHVLEPINDLSRISTYVEKQLEKSLYIVRIRIMKHIMNQEDED